MKSRMPERARTDPWEPQGSNPLGPPGPELTHLTHNPITVHYVPLARSRRCQREPAPGFAIPGDLELTTDPRISRTCAGSVRQNLAATVPLTVSEYSPDMEPPSVKRNAIPNQLVRTRVVIRQASKRTIVTAATAHAILQVLVSRFKS